MIDVDHGRDLTRAELRVLVAGLARQPQAWRHLVQHDPTARTYEQLVRDEHVAIWLICWMDDHDTGFHDHDVSCGALAVAQGAVVEERLALGGPPIRRRMRAGDAIDFAASDIHRVAHGGGGPAITLNAYSPPLWRMGAYETTPTGELQRHSISYAEELRPLQLVALGPIRLGSGASACETNWDRSLSPPNFPRVAGECTDAVG